MNMTRPKLPWLILTLAIQSYAANIEHIRHGEKLFFSYCSGCHSLKYTSYPKVSMPHAEATRWFKITPPDLSLTANYRGKKWIARYLSGFYKDESRPFGSNNKILINTQMPNVLAELEYYNISSSKNINAEKQPSEEILDIAEFLEAIANPNQQTSYKIGFGVLFFLAVFLIKILSFRKNIKQLT